MAQTLLDQVAALEARAQGDYVDDRINADVRQLCAKLRECVEAMDDLREAITITMSEEHNKICQAGRLNTEEACRQAKKALAPWPEAR